MKTFPKAIAKRISEINAMIDIINQLDEIPYTYGGGTFPSYIQLTKDIVIKNQFVYIHEVEGRYNYGFDKRYNVNCEGSLEMLKYDLSLIYRTFRKSLRRTFVVPN